MYSRVRDEDAIEYARRISLFRRAQGTARRGSRQAQDRELAGLEIGHLPANCCDPDDHGAGGYFLLGSDNGIQLRLWHANSPFCF
jgi:hypothetical protein